jgi:cytochrome P450
VQDKIAEELDSLGLLAKPGCPAPCEMEWDDLKKLPYLTAATKEAMRMLPVVSVMGRVAGQDMMCGPYKIPKGTVVGTPLFAIHNTIHNWVEPEVFRPERWLDVPVETYVYDSTTGTTGGES